MNTRNIKYFRIYIAVALIHLLVTSDHHFPVFSGYALQPLIIMISKALLMPSLLLGYFLETRNKQLPRATLLISALIFSWIGDVVLLWQGQDQLFFIAGLVAFLIAHICYVLLFYRDPMSLNSIIKNPLPAILLLAYGIIFFTLIRRSLGDLLLPVMMYEVVILGMGISAINRKGSVRDESFFAILLGSLIFIASDSMLAVNKFVHPFIGASVMIMFTYILAQGLIVYGALRNTTVGVKGL